MDGSGRLAKRTQQHIQEFNPLNVAPEAPAPRPPPEQRLQLDPIQPPPVEEAIEPVDAPPAAAKQEPLIEDALLPQATAPVHH